MRLNGKKACIASSMILCTHFHVLCIIPFFCMEKLLLYLRGPTLFGKGARYEEESGSCSYIMLR